MMTHMEAVDVQITHLPRLELALRADDDHLPRVHVSYTLKADGAKRAVLRGNAVLIAQCTGPSAQH